ncbi:MAG: hypothetical protein ABI600_07145 [Luteolibacter sp.]
MKIFQTTGFLWLLLSSPVFTQVAIPANPQRFRTRPVGGSLSPLASVEPNQMESEKIRYVTHIVLYESRFWTNTEGKPLEGKLIAFEDLVAEAPKGAAEPEMPAPPPNPTVTRGGKIRLLVNQKAVEIALDRLSQSDREFIEQMKAALEKKAKADH